MRNLRKYHDKSWYFYLGEILQTFIDKNKNWFEISHKNKLSGIMICK